MQTEYNNIEPQPEFNDSLHDFYRVLCMLDEESLKRANDFLHFLTGITEEQRAAYDELKKKADTAFNKDPFWVSHVTEYGMPKILAGESGADIWEQYLDEEKGCLRALLTKEGGIK